MGAGGNRKVTVDLETLDADPTVAAVWGVTRGRAGRCGPRARERKRAELGFRPKYCFEIFFWFSN